MKKFYLALVLIGVAIFAWALVQLLEVRFARGDIYPPYSTLRADPLGARAFYDSLAELDRLSVSRNELPLERFRASEPTTLFCLGTKGLSGSEEEIVHLEKFVKGGGRLVIAFFPQSTGSGLVERKRKSTPSPSPSPSAEEEPPLVKILSTSDVAKRWEFKLETDRKLSGSEATRNVPDTIDEKISWHSVLHFQGSSPEWKTIYLAGKFPVVMERQIGAGTMVLASDSYFASNEAMRRERRPAFLAWLIGSNGHLVFDETHLGISENPGISTLLRRYRLGGLLAGLVVFALMAVWKSAARLIPVGASKDGTEETVIGKESFAGFVNLLRRNVAPSELLGTCVSEWMRLSPQTEKKSKTRIDQAQAIVVQSPDDIVDAYGRISDALHQTKWKPAKTN